MLSSWRCRGNTSLLKADIYELSAGMSREGFYLDLKLNNFLIFVNRNDPVKRIQLYSDDPRAETILWDDFKYSCELAGVEPEPFESCFHS